MGGTGSGLGSKCVSNHVPNLTVPMVLPFRVLGWGGVRHKRREKQRHEISEINRVTGGLGRIELVQKAHGQSQFIHCFIKIQAC